MTYNPHHHHPSSNNEIKKLVLLEAKVTAIGETISATAYLVLNMIKMCFALITHRNFTFFQKLFTDLYISLIMMVI